MVFLKCKTCDTVFLFGNTPCNMTLSCTIGCHGVLEEITEAEAERITEEHYEENSS